MNKFPAANGLGIVVVMLGLVINMKGEWLAQIFKLKASRQSKGLEEFY